jgi:AcrR family transcriptional regulator
MRSEALVAARRLVVDKPDEVLTLRALADATGVTRPNLNHHFGSLAGLHAALALEMVRELLASLRTLGIEVDSNEDDAALVDRVFTLFNQQGLARVLGWLVRSGKTERLKPIDELLTQFIKELGKGRSNDRRKLLARDALILSFAAFAEASVGELLGSIFHISAAQRRRYFVQILGAMSNAR